jgi:mannosyltransferase OCH1-like enzyme
MKFLLVLLILPLLLLVLLVAHTHGGSSGSTANGGQIPLPHHVISPETLKLRSKRILERQSHKKKDSFRSKLGSPDHKRQTHLRRDGETNKQNKPAAWKPPAVAVLTQTLPPEHNHVIPNVLIFTHSINLLETENPTGEDAALKANVENSIALHPGADVHFLTDEDCLESIARVMGSASPLLEFFVKETHGMYKADICRGAALYELGGLYMDVDMQARMSLWSVVGSETTFVVPIVHRESKHPGSFFQSFIGTTAKNPILKRYLKLFINYYEGKLDLQGPLGVLLLRKAHDDIIGAPNHPAIKMKEEDYLDQVPQYFLEVLHDPKLFPNVPPPDRGTRRACRFVVVANNQEPFVVPFYSRVRGSRMCGGSDSEKTGR